MNKCSIFIIAIMIFGSSCLPDEDTIPDSNDDRDKITYSWSCAENNPIYGVQYFYDVNIEKDSINENKVLIYNFYGLDDDSFLKATMTGMKLIIANEVIEGHVVSGEGTITSNYKTINWTYEVTELKKSTNGIESSEIVTATYTR